MVTDGQNGFLVTVHDIETTAEKIAELANCPAFRTAMGNKSRQMYVDQYTHNRYLNGIKRVFEAALGE
jgi:glycosyltransferase involved in cell wall biosynthesis